MSKDISNILEELSAEGAKLPEYFHDEFGHVIPIAAKNPLGDLMEWAAVRTETPSWENIGKAAVVLGVNLNPLTGIPMLVGEVLNNPIGVAKSIPEVISKTVIACTPPVEAVRLGWDEEQKRIWTEEPETPVMGGLMVAGVAGGVARGLRKVRSAAGKAIDVMGGDVPEVTTDVEVKAAISRAATGDDLTPRDVEVVTRLADQVNSTLDNIKNDAIARQSVDTDPLKIISVDNAGLKKIQEYTGLQKLPKPQKQATEKLYYEALDAGYDKNAVAVAQEVLDIGRPLSDMEQVGMLARTGQIIAERKASILRETEYAANGDLKKADIERGRITSLDAELQTIEDGGRVGGAEWGRSGRMRQLLFNTDDFSISYVLDRVRSASKGKKISVKETKEYEAMVKARDDAVAELSTYKDKLVEAEVQKEFLLAERAALAEIKKSKRATRNTVDANITMYKSKLAKMGLELHDISGIAPEGLYYLGRLAIEYMKKGVYPLENVAARLVSDSGGILTPEDVYRAINTKNPNRIGRVRSEAQLRVDTMTRQAQWIDRINKYLQKIYDEPGIREPDPAVIKDLKQTLKHLKRTAYLTGEDGVRLERIHKSIRALQDHLDNHTRAAKEVQPVPSDEIVSAQGELKKLHRQMSLEDRIKDLNQQLDTGVFKIKEKPKDKPIDPELTKLEIAVRDKTRAIQRRIDAAMPLTPMKVTEEIANTLRTIKATADMSGVLRQGMVLSAARPQDVPKAFGKSFKAFFSRYTAEEVDIAIRSADHHYMRELAKLYLSPVDDVAGLREEMFQSNLLRSGVAKYVGLKAVTGASERHMVTYLNMLRSSAFDEFYFKYPNATMTELQAWADFINKATGRGDLGAFGAAAKYLALVSFAPRFQASRFQTPYAVIKHWQHPRVRNMIARDMVRFVGTGITALTLAKLSGCEVGLNPRSPDWGKMVIGNSHVDLWAGMQQPTRLIARTMFCVTDRAGLSGAWSPKKDNNDPVDLMERFAEFKLSPLVTLPRELLRGRTATNRKTTPLSTLASAAMPMVVESIYNAAKDEYALGIGLAATEFFGTSVSTY